MELFRLTCVTCKARLSVRNASAIGQILSCPRCGSMVQVTPPPDLRVSAENTESSSVPEACTSAPARHAVAEDFHATESFVPDTVDVSAEVSNTPENIAERRGPLAQLAVTCAQGLNTVTWKIAAVMVCGTLIAMAVFLRGNSTSPSEAVADNNASKNIAQAAPVDSNAATPTSPKTSPPVESEPTISPNVIEAEPARVATPEPENTQPEPTAEIAVTAETETREPNVQSGEPPSTNTTIIGADRDTVPTQTKSPDLPRFDPLDLDPEGFDLASLHRSTQLPATKDKTSRQDKQLKNVLPEQESPVADRSRNTVEINTQAVRRNPDGPLNVSLPAASDQLALELPALEIERMPLHAFLDFLSRLANVPISLGPEQLQMAAISADAPVSVDRKQATIGDILQNALKPLHLVYKIEGPHVLILHADSEKRREIKYPIDDLVSSNTSTAEKNAGKDARQLADWIERLIAPAAWQSAGGDGKLKVEDGHTLRIEQSQRVQYQVLCFLEQLRIARKLETRSRYPSQRLSIISADDELVDKLNMPATFTYSHYTPLGQIFAHWQEYLDVAILVDWPALVEEQMSPQTQIACSVIDQPWHDALDTVLSPLGLAWRRIDDHTLQITTALVADGKPQLEFYAIESFGLRSTTRLASDLRDLVDQQRTADIPPAHTDLIIDPVSNTLLARQPSASQQLIVSWLQSHGKMVD